MWILGLKGLTDHFRASVSEPLFQSETKCEAVDMEMNSFSQDRFCTQPPLKSESFWSSEMANCLNMLKRSQNYVTVVQSLLQRIYTNLF